MREYYYDIIIWSVPLTVSATHWPLKDYPGGIMMKKKMILILAAALLLQGCAPIAVNVEMKQDGAQSNAEAYRSVLLNEDYGADITYVIGHKSPDSDTVGSAIAYSLLLNELGIEAKAVVSGKINNETKFALDYFGMDVPEIVDDATGKQFVLVDHSTYTQTIDGMENARVVGIVDHHGIGDVVNPELINVRSAPVGATGSLVYQTYKECDIPISKDAARAMLMAIISDTTNAKHNMTVIDDEAYASLKEIAGIDDFDAFAAGMLDAQNSYAGMTDLEIYQSDYKEYEVGGTTFGIGVVNAATEEDHKAISEKMIRAMDENYDDIGLDMLFVMVKCKPEDKMVMAGSGEGANELLMKCFGNFDGDRLFLFDENVSRKKYIVPVLTEALE